MTADLDERRLSVWMVRVLEERRKALGDLSSEVVHDLRVAIRRCRSVAEGLRSLDPHKDWRRMRREGRELFLPLGTLRDIHVMMDWVRRLSEPDDGLGQALMGDLRLREAKEVAQAQEALTRFDSARWEAWSSELPERAAGIPLDSPAFEHLALERWQDGRALHEAAVKLQTPDAYHRLRVGVKRFRYTVENFLPSRYEAWEKELKKLQDLLGDVHDLDVLVSMLPESVESGSAGPDARWREKIAEERRRRLAAYARKTAGERGVWERWREGLPRGRRLAGAALAKLSARARFQDSDYPATERVAEEALGFYESLRGAGKGPSYAPAVARRVLQAAALLRHAGGAKSRAWKDIAELEPPIGWDREELLMAALTVRYRYEAPRASHRTFASLTEAQRGLVCFLAGVLRTAEAAEWGSQGKNA